MDGEADWIQGAEHHYSFGGHQLPRLLLGAALCNREFRLPWLATLPSRVTRN